LDERAEEAEKQSFSELTVELVEQAARLAGERLGSPIRAAGSYVARLLVLVGAALAALAVGVTFLGIAIGNVVGLAPAEQRWWIYLLVAVGFLLVAGMLVVIALRGRKSGAETSGTEDAE
jgi:hypothetical protein